MRITDICNRANKSLNVCGFGKEYFPFYDVMTEGVDQMVVVCLEVINLITVFTKSRY
jgi:hypothetical protein